MVDGGFRERFHLLNCLEEQTLDKSEYEVIWVEYYNEIPAEVANSAFVRTITLNNPKNVMYHSSYCFNRGIRESRGELAVIIDADVVVERDFLESVWLEHQRYDELAMYIVRLDQDQQYSSQDVSLERLKQVCQLRSPSNFGGCLTVRKCWLEAINGYEQHRAFASNYHSNGLDVNARLKNLGLAVKWHSELRLYHPWHPGTHGERREQVRGVWQRDTITKRQFGRVIKAWAGLDGTICDASEPPQPANDPDLHSQWVLPDGCEKTVFVF